MPMIFAASASGVGGLYVHFEAPALDGSPGDGAYGGYGHVPEEAFCVVHQEYSRPLP